MKKVFPIINYILLALTGIFLIALQFKPWAWLFLVLGLLSLRLCQQKLARALFLIYLSLAILGLTPITTDISYRHMLQMGLALMLAVALPYFIARHIYKEKLIVFPWRLGRKWFKKEISYILLTAVIAYFLLPFYLINTGAYLNWSVEPGLSSIIRLFIGTNALGIWDELFFICTVLGLLKKFMDFKYANILQAVLFTSFLYELGFTSWGFVMIFLFAWLQGLIFHKTHSLAYVITIHLTLDFILFLALIWAHHPGWLTIFVV
ncbi:MAG: CAAX protease family protein [Candidatus Komeilibacteria bacterium CG10_big_fil_rev_8_21_14_0_10_41_13]|uniref:CAAX protease family protein n=1 Tax=Candidatus Komeilibacteria bacterium CG10_big_fil_rev_8_21_14_0_10_41_13 TaxID=1974476 RepID=A0A2M6WD03_9BACT|nr:MAG: CAAX protease family protein [Candidatus Komeilibacteria bacterium CG10_big_fil_rev_8_21_14_0_10_41_13]